MEVEAVEDESDSIQKELNVSGQPGHLSEGKGEDFSSTYEADTCKESRRGEREETHGYFYEKMGHVCKLVCNLVG